MPNSHAFLPSSEAEAVVRSLPSAFHLYRGPCFSFRFWDGSTWTCSSDSAIFVVSFRTERAWKRFRSPVSKTDLAELFISGEIDIEGNLYAAIRSYQSIHSSIDRGLGSVVAFLVGWLKGLSRYRRMFLAANSVHREPANGMACSIHPERPYEWYRLWLGKSMVFSSGYFQTFREDLDQAQENGLEQVCNKLQLARGDRFLDLSCNWGSLLMHVAMRNEVTAHGFSQDNEQIATTELKLIQAELTSRCDVQFGDYKSLRKIKTPFSKIACIGLSEHPGQRQLPEYFRSVSGKLRVGGLFLCDFLTGSTPHERFPHFSPGVGMFEREFLTLSRILECAEAAGLSIVNVDEMKDHYEETLRLWFLALTKHRHELARLANRKSVRAWELYIACLAESLRAGHISLHQILFRKGLNGVAIMPPLSNRWQREGDLYPLPYTPHSLDGTSCAYGRW